MAIAPLRRGLPINTPRERPPSPREVARWITTAPSRRSLRAAEALPRLFEYCPELNRAHDLVRQFAAMLDTRDAAPLTDWLGRAWHLGAPQVLGGACRWCVFRGARWCCSGGRGVLPESDDIGSLAGAASRLAGI